MCARCGSLTSHGILERRSVLAMLSATATAPLLAACGDEGGGVADRVVPDAMVRRLGLESWERLRAQARLSSNDEYQAALRSVGERLLASAGEDPSGWEMRVFAGSQINAFALPGGKIGVYEGMFDVAGGKDELAAVVGHEIGHNLADHAQERLATQAAKQVGLRLVSAALQLGDVEYANQIAGLLGIGIQFGLELPYSRRQELEADRLGLEIMADAGFDPRAGIRLWEAMDQAARNRPPELLSTHPAPKARIEAMREMLPDLREG